MRVGILACALAGLVLFLVCILHPPHRLFAGPSRTLSRDTHASLHACALQGWGLRQPLCACLLQVIAAVSLYRWPIPIQLRRIDFCICMM